jgi:hypothetical protein
MTQIWILSCVEELEPKCLGTSVLTCIGHFTRTIQVSFVKTRWTDTKAMDLD